MATAAGTALGVANARVAFDMPKACVRPELDSVSSLDGWKVLVSDPSAPEIKRKDDETWMGRGLIRRLHRYFLTCLFR